MKRPKATGIYLMIALTPFGVVGCSNTTLAENYLNGGNENYVTGSVIKEVEAADRGEAISFSGTNDSGTLTSRDDYDGKVVVVNFWYAECSPCRSEAPSFASLSGEYASSGVQFIGVNTQDRPEKAAAFAKRFNVTYPSILDATSGEVRLAFAGEISPTAVPTTFVLDRQGRIASRIVGELQDDSILSTLIEDVLKEDATSNE